MPLSPDTRLGSYQITAQIRELRSLGYQVERVPIK
jgi:biotin operon repressor